MTSYLSILVKIRKDINVQLNDELDDIVSAAERDMIIFIIVLVVIVVICLIVALW